VKPLLYKEKLLWIRLNKGWSQEKAAEHCHASDKKQYHLWETGKTLLPRAYQLDAMANGLGITVDELLLKPGQTPELPLQIFYNAHYRRPMGELTQSEHAEKHYRLVCLSLDGALLRGFQFSWEEIWHMLGDPLNLHKKGLQMFHSGKISYADWCLWCCEIFRSYQLNREQLHALAQHYSVIKNFHAGMAALRAAGFRIALVAGGIDTFLQALIPDYPQLFDQVFINKLLFDPSGTLMGVVPTPFDLERKPDAIAYLCSLYGLHTAQSIYVGSNFVDKYVIRTAGKTIALNSPSDEIQQLFDISLTSEDFCELANTIISLNSNQTQA
jgi:phosphoserine phosphatase